MTVDFHASERRFGVDEVQILAREVERLGAVVTACRLSRPDPSTGRRRSLSEISGALASLGYVDVGGAPYDVASVARLLGQDAAVAPARVDGGARHGFDRPSLAALLDLGLSIASIARYLRLPEQDVHRLCEAYRL